MFGILRVKISNRSSDRFLSPNGPTNPNFCSRLVTRLIRITSKQLEYHGDGSSLCRLKPGSLLERTLVKLCRPGTANLLSAHLDTKVLVELTMFEVSFKIQHDCPYTRFSMKNPDVRLVEWCNNRIHVMEVDCPDIETFTRVEKDLNELLMWKGGKVLKKNFLDRNLQLIIKTCRCSKISPNISDIIEKHSFLWIPPEVYYGGWEEYKVVGFREADYKRMFQELSELGPVQIIEKKVLPEKSLRDAFVISMSSVFSELTDKQVSSLLSALEYGYYQIPKKMTAEEIAQKHHVPRTTFEEHLRKAESKILRAIAPYVRMYSSTSEDSLERPPQIPTK